MKSITLDGMTFKLTNERISRISREILRTQKQLKKELAYSKDLQNHDMVEEYQNHITALESMLS